MEMYHNPIQTFHKILLGQSNIEKVLERETSIVTLESKLHQLQSKPRNSDNSLNLWQKVNFNFESLIFNFFF